MAIWLFPWLPIMDPAYNKTFDMFVAGLGSGPGDAQNVAKVLLGLDRLQM